MLRAEPHGDNTLCCPSVLAGCKHSLGQGAMALLLEHMDAQFRPSFERTLCVPSVISSCVDVDAVVSVLSSCVDVDGVVSVKAPHRDSDPEGNSVCLGVWF